MTAFGVTVAQMLGLQLESELSSEIKKFARHESEVFDNRKDHVHKNAGGPHDTYQPTSYSQGRLLNNDDIRKKPSGRGVIGILSKTKSSAQLKDVGHMEGVTRMRIPRAFAYNTASPWLPGSRQYCFSLVTGFTKSLSGNHCQ